MYMFSFVYIFFLDRQTIGRSRLFFNRPLGVRLMIFCGLIQTRYGTRRGIQQEIGASQ